MQPPKRSVGGPEFSRIRYSKRSVGGPELSSTGHSTTATHYTSLVRVHVVRPMALKVSIENKTETLQTQAEHPGEGSESAMEGGSAVCGYNDLLPANMWQSLECCLVLAFGYRKLRRYLIFGSPFWLA